jgi:hypothetical protein
VDCGVFLGAADSRIPAWGLMRATSLAAQGHLGRQRSQAKRTQVQQLALDLECATGDMLAGPGRLVTQLMAGDPGAASALWPGASPMVLFSW